MAVHTPMIGTQGDELAEGFVKVFGTTRNATARRHNGKLSEATGR